jgi:glycosyltransferase involved in cell wall biosynthesis
MRFINIVDTASSLNFGVWNAAVINAGVLKEKGVKTELWYSGEKQVTSEDVIPVNFSDPGYKTLESLILTRQLNPDNDLIITSGVWRFPTKWGAFLKAKGFQWIFVPQGMLEPWPLRQKWLKKKIYFSLVEKRQAINATVIRAVSKPEEINLKRLFPNNRIEYIPNGVQVTSKNINHRLKRRNVTGYLFLSRLHHKKNIIALAQAWVSSKLNNNPLFQLIIAGPDQGELIKLQQTLSMSGNMSYVGLVKGATKEALFDNATFYVLPSFSEGLPSALLEAMASGIIPIITEGCNFPDVFEHKIGVKITTEKSSIQYALENTSLWDSDTILEKSRQCRELIQSEYSLEAVTNKQIRIYQESN